MSHTEELNKDHNKDVAVAEVVPTTVQNAPDVDDGNKLSKLKLAFLYTLIGGLVASAIVAIVSVLLGEYNTGAQRALWTIVIFVTHSLLILGLIWADTNNRLGRSVLPTTLLGVTLANIVTTTLGNWGVIEGDTAWKAFLFYMLITGSAFIISGSLKLRIAHSATRVLLYSTVGLLVAWTALLAPWVFSVVEYFNPLYYRIASALTILVATLFIVAVIVRGIALARSKQLRDQTATQPRHSIPGGMLAYYITIGVIASFVWLSGFFVFIVDGINDTNYFERGETTRTIRR